ncbi:MAG: ferrochelatase [Anaerolineales bacterium]|nr:ferrochelatase [Anaerolineales bacterium]
MSFFGTESYQHGLPSPIGILLTNVGTPAAPTVKAVRPYLAEFLSDKRIIEMPGWQWQPVLHGVLLNTRPRKSAQLYQRVWTEAGSPLLLMLERQAKALQAYFDKTAPIPIKVSYGMRYGQPSISNTLRELHMAHVRRLLVLPLFPQYSATTTATSLDAVFAELQTWRWLPELRTINHYHDHPGYIQAIANSIREQWAKTGQPQRLLFSFHGIPKSYFLAGDPYFCECQESARLIAEELELPDDMWFVSFQSRLGRQEWLRPYTDETLKAWGSEGLQHVDAVCPGFSADCLETSDEVGHEGKLSFQEAGGGQFNYIPALNDRADHIQALANIINDNLQGWLTPPQTNPQLLARVQIQRQKFENIPPKKVTT